MLEKAMAHYQLIFILKYESLTWAVQALLLSCGQSQQWVSDHYYDPKAFINARNKFSSVAFQYDFSNHAQQGWTMGWTLDFARTNPITAITWTMVRGMLMWLVQILDSKSGVYQQLLAEIRFLNFQWRHGLMLILLINALFG